MEQTAIMLNVQVSMREAVRTLFKERRTSMSKRAEEYLHQFDQYGIPVTNWTWEDMVECYDDSRKQAEEDLGWHSVEESIPSMDEEVIVLSNVVNGHYISSARRISFGHIVNKEICVDYDGWNIPGVKYWMPCPKLPEN